MILRKLVKICLWAGALCVPALVYGYDKNAVPDDMSDADIVFLGEQHDNPHHHTTQAAYVAGLSPSVLVFEMLTPEQASRITPALLRDQDALKEALEWEASGWPDFSMYYPIFAAAHSAIVKGAGVPRQALRDIVGSDLVTAAGQDMARRFGLDQPLTADQQAAREALQRESHCNALPEELLPGMVNVQRFRDAMLAQEALDGFEMSGGPVVVITGNGHARLDWGAPFLVQLAAPDVRVFALGQGEDGSVPAGGFTHVEDTPSVDRGDPCDAFR